MSPTKDTVLSSGALVDIGKGTGYSLTVKCQLLPVLTIGYGYGRFGPLMLLNRPDISVSHSGSIVKILPSIPLEWSDEDVAKASFPWKG
jgi:hypothetical protein